MPPLRIVHISYDWYRFDPLVRRLAEAARARGHLVDVICLRHGSEPSYEECHGVAVYRVPLDRGFGQPLPLTVLGWLRFLFLAAWTVTRLHFRKRYDVIQVHNMPDFLVFAALIPRLFGARVILEVQDASPELMAVKTRGRLRSLARGLAALQERVSTLFANHVITVGWPFEELLLRRGVPRHKLSVILNSPDPRYFPPSQRTRVPSTEEDGDFILMYHGTMAERHGLDVALHALALALPAAPRLRLDLLGRGEQIPFLHTLAEELGISDRVTFRETCTVEEVAHFIAHGDVGIIPYRCDGFMDLLLPTKAYEFAWLHRPIIATDTKAIRSMFRPESVVLCEPENPLSLAAAIVDLYHHPEKRAQLVENAAKDFEPFRWELMSERYNELLERICDRRRSQRSVSLSQEISKQHLH
ncbi:glycosyltransferase family 4 protein [Thermogemmatispora carboxidivorans]|uniref:glycosyltransferase family 4 protein n=1 Tax=Thermogemmatispora carboxidivorans TaxID=1382306 RepID=UPI00069B065A|nr:glycosyltransferase family 4 protein [Thermogemmatispora carboxidivorans]